MSSTETVKPVKSVKINKIIYGPTGRIGITMVRHKLNLSSDKYTKDRESPWLDKICVYSRRDTLRTGGHYG